MGAEQFGRIIRGLHDRIRDVSLVCEGSERLLQPELLDPARTVRVTRFQASYDYRSDNAAKLDLYTHGDAADSLFIRQTFAILGRNLEKYSAAPDQKRIAQVSAQAGSPSALNVLGSPRAIMFMWYFRYHGDHLAEMNFKDLGWDVVDGRSCRKVGIDFLPNMPAKQRAFRVYWIDLERGGHPLRVENYRKERLVTRTGEVQLGRFMVDGEEIWLPVEGVQQTFMWGTLNGIVYSDKPITEARYHVVKGTVRLNQGLSDDFFRLRKKGEPIAARRPLELARDFDKAAELPPAERSDPISVRKRLDERLVEADKQAAALMASSRARTSWGAVTIAELMFTVVGVVVLCAAWFIWRRGKL